MDEHEQRQYAYCGERDCEVYETNRKKNKLIRCNGAMGLASQKSITIKLIDDWIIDKEEKLKWEKIVGKWIIVEQNKNYYIPCYGLCWDDNDGINYDPITKKCKVIKINDDYFIYPFNSNYKYVIKLN